MSISRILAFVLAGGEGKRLRPLTAEHAKPALHFAEGYRIVDFVLGNLINSAVDNIYVLGQYKPQSLVEHIEDAWRAQLCGTRTHLEVLLPGANDGPYQGTADAVYRNLHLIERHQPDLVAVFAADHVYRMDVRQMARFHRTRAADVTVAAVPVPIVEASSFGIISASAMGEIHRFHEKPARPAPMLFDPSRAYASMGNYLFEPAALNCLLEEAVQTGGTDFGHHVLPGLGTCGCRAFAYDFSDNRVPGLAAFEEHAYWRDVGSLEALAAARNDVRGPRPLFNLRNAQWPIRPELAAPAPLIVSRQPQVHNDQIENNRLPVPAAGLDLALRV